MLPLFSAIAVLFVVSGVITMVEAALFCVPLSRVHVAVGQKRRGARRLLAIKTNLQRPIGTLVVLNNTTNIAGSMLIAREAEEHFGSAGMGLFTGLFTFCMIVVAEILPKTIGERLAGPIALRSAPLLGLLTRVFSPLLWLIEKITSPLASRGGAHVVSEEEIRTLASIGNSAGAIDQHESELIRNVFHLNDVTAKDIMTHRLMLSFIPAEARLSDLKLDEVAKMHSRILVAAQGDLDKVDGVLYQRDLLLAIAQGRTEKTVGEVKHPVHVVYEGTPAHRLLREFQRSRQHLFVVVDEYGGTSGVVSLEDVLEELVGEIEDEMDAREQAALEKSRARAASS